MNQSLYPMALAALLALGSCGKSTVGTAETTAPEGAEIFFADPTIVVENGKYYLTGTREHDATGFTLLESTDLQNWTLARPDSAILTRGHQTYGDKGFWAPQIFKDGNKFRYLYTANEQLAMALGDSINALYTQPTVEPIDGSEKNIDPFLFRDTDGKYYLYHVRFNNGNWLWVGEFDPATGHIVPNTLQPCFRNTQPWEVTDAYPCVPIMEGPTLVKIDDLYYLFYSANHFLSDDYAVGYATAPTPLGPWTKNPSNPVIHRNIVGEKGSGHGDIFTDLQGRLRYVYHVHHNDSTPTPRRTRIITLNLDKSHGAPYRITADPSTIIIPRR